MRKIHRSIALVLLAAFLFGFAPALPAHAADEDYDPMNTMLALNMAIVSINKIVSTQDRIVLDQEYNTIINRLAPRRTRRTTTRPGGALTSSTRFGGPC